MWECVVGDEGEYLNAVLKCPGIVWVREFDYRELVGPLQVLHPFVGLSWRKDSKSITVHTPPEVLFCCDE